WRTFESNLLNAARRQRDFATWSLLDAALRAVLPLAVLPLLGPSAAGVLTAYALGALLASLPFLGALVRGSPGEADDGTTRDWLGERRGPFRRSLLPIAPTVAMIWFVAAADRPWIATVSGLAAAGVYSAVYGLASQPFLAANALGLVTFRPILFAAASA